MIKKLTIMVMVSFLMFSKGGNIMADYNIQMGQRNPDNTEWDNHYPITKVDNVLTQNGTVASQLAETIRYSYPSINDHIYNLDRLSNWFSKLSSFTSNSKTINVSIVGDSISEGNAAGNGDFSQFFEKGYLGQLKNKFKADFGDAGKGFIPVYLTYGAPIWTFNGFTPNTGYFGAVGHSMQSANNGDTATISFRGVGIGILFPKRNDAGILSISIDGGVPIEINTYSATEIAANKHEITGLTNGEHTMVITSVLTGSQRVWIFGAYEVSAATGIRFNMVGKSGLAINRATLPLALPTEIDIWEPTLTIIALTANDYGGQTPLETYEAGLQTLITRATTFGDVLIVSIGLEVPIVSETIPQIEYVKIQKKLAKLNNVAFFDMYSMWSGNADIAKNSLGFIRDVVHPTDEGHTDIANRLYEVLTKNVQYTEIFASKITSEDKGILSGGVLGNGYSKKIIKAFGHRQETSSKDLILFIHNAPVNTGDSATIMGKIKSVFAGRNTGGANACAVCEYDFYYDKKGNMTLTQKNTYSPSISGATVTMELTKKEAESIIQIKILPSVHQIHGSVFCEIEYTQAFTYEPIIVKFSEDLI